MLAVIPGVLLVNVGRNAPRASEAKSEAGDGWTFPEMIRGEAKREPVTNSDTAEVGATVIEVSHFELPGPTMKWANRPDPEFEDYVSASLRKAGKTPPLRKPMIQENSLR